MISKNYLNRKELLKKLTHINAKKYDWKHLNESIAKSTRNLSGKKLVVGNYKPKPIEPFAFPNDKRKSRKSKKAFIQL
jgi:penicillin-binding protein-related factor A (putative recombinase)